MKLIYIGGYAGSGSSALIDYFKEDPTVATLDFEQRFIVDPDGLINLCHVLNSSPTPYEVDLAVARFFQLLENLSVKYSIRSYAGFVLPEAAIKALILLRKELTDNWIFNYKGIWLQQNHLLHQALHKIDRLLSIGVSKTVHKNTYCLRSDRNVAELYDELMDSYLSILLESSAEKDVVVLDEPYMSLSFGKLEKISSANNFLVAVHRDPRDQYLNAKRFSYQFVPRDVKKFVDWFKMQKQLLSAVSSVSGVRLDLNFEDLVLDYDESISKVAKFIGRDLYDQKNKFKYFNPDISKKNLKQYEKEHGYKDDVAYIEQELSEYLFFQ